VDLRVYDLHRSLLSLFLSQANIVALSRAARAHDPIGRPKTFGWPGGDPISTMLESRMYEIEISKPPRSCINTQTARSEI
jgi:hypothetical protein